MFYSCKTHRLGTTPAGPAGAQPPRISLLAASSRHPASTKQPPQSTLFEARFSKPGRSVYLDFVPLREYRVIIQFRSKQYTVYSIQCASRRIKHRTQYTVHSVQHAVHITVYNSKHSIQYTVYSILEVAELPREGV